MGRLLIDIFNFAVSGEKRGREKRGIDHQESGEKRG
jgi:hypothetical protein